MDEISDSPHVPWPNGPQASAPPAPLRATVAAGEWGAHYLSIPGGQPSHLRVLSDIPQALERARAELLQQHPQGSVVVDFLKGKSILGDTHEQRYVDGASWEHEPLAGDEDGRGFDASSLAQVLLTEPHRTAAVRNDEDQIETQPDRTLCVWVVRDWHGGRVTQRIELRASEATWLRDALERWAPYETPSGDPVTVAGVAAVSSDPTMRVRTDEAGRGLLLRALRGLWERHPNATFGELIEEMARRHAAADCLTATPWSRAADDDVLRLINSMLDRP